MSEASSQRVRGGASTGVVSLILVLPSLCRGSGSDRHLLAASFNFITNKNSNKRLFCQLMSEQDIILQLLPEGLTDMKGLLVDRYGLIEAQVELQTEMQAAKELIREIIKNIILIMSNPVQTTVELSKNEKIKLLNERLSNMLKQKKVDPTKVVETALNVAKEEQKKQQTQPKPSEEKVEIEEKDQLSGKLPDKEKKIKKEDKKDVRTLRKAAGQVWEDKTMEDWPENDYRIFCGNLGNEVNDEILASIFRRYHSFQMARVVRDRRTGKTRGYGFVSLTNPNDFLNALKEMNGKHVGNRPVKLMKSSWKDRNLNSAQNQYLPSDFRKNAQKETHKICVNYNYVSSL